MLSITDVKSNVMEAQLFSPLRLDLCSPFFFKLSVGQCYPQVEARTTCGLLGSDVPCHD